jgi:hypothetical protein
MIEDSLGFYVADEAHSRDPLGSDNRQQARRPSASPLRNGDLKASRVARGVGVQDRFVVEGRVLRCVGSLALEDGPAE